MTVQQLFISLLYGLGITFIMFLILIIIFIAYRLIVDFKDKLYIRKEYILALEKLKESVYKNDELLKNKGLKK